MWFILMFAFCFSGTFIRKSEGSGILNFVIGQPGGSTFIPPTVVHKLGLKAGNYLDQIQINGIRYGVGGGGYKGSITLDSDEYINKVSCRYGIYIDRVDFWTNKGKYIGGGGGGGGTHDQIENVRVLSISGRAGKYVDLLEIRYIPNYRPSASHYKNVGFILSYTPPFSRMEQYSGSRYRMMHSYTKAIENMARIHYDANIQAEFIIRASANYGFEIQHTSLQTFKTEMERELERKLITEQQIPEGHVGVQLVNGEILRGASGSFWMFPTSTPSYSVIKLSEVKNLLGHYDLTGELHTQMPGLKKYKIVQNGFVTVHPAAEEVLSDTTLVVPESSAIVVRIVVESSAGDLKNIPENL